MQQSTEVTTHVIRVGWTWASVFDAVCDYVNNTLEDRNQIISINTTITQNGNEALVSIYHYTSPNNGRPFAPHLQLAVESIRSSGAWKDTLQQGARVIEAKMKEGSFVSSAITCASIASTSDGMVNIFYLKASTTS